MNFLYGIIMIAGGVAILRFRHQIYEFTGEWGWANTYLGSNGTVVAISLIGMLLIGIGTAYPFGVIDFSPENQEATQPFRIR